jgi:uncharacterized protein YciI
MAHFLVRLIPPRPSFPWDMTDAEQALMARHAAYLRELTAKGTCIVAGPVLDRADPWGLCIFDAATEAEARRLASLDPTVAAGLNRVDIRPMRVSMERSRAPAPT